MNFLSPLTALLAAAIAIPLLLLLYFLKLRRRYLRIASTLLWRQSYEDLEVNAPFQRLKWSSLLVLQLLVLLALLFALAGPIVQGRPHEATRLILLIDRSASMNALLPSPTGRGIGGDGASGLCTRLDAAKDAAKETIERLARGASAREVMVIAYGSQPHVVSTFQFDRRTLISAIDAIEPTDEEANLSAALHLAAGFAGHSEVIGDQEAEIVLFSDGVVDMPDDPAGFRLRAGSFRFVQIVPHLAPGESPRADSTQTNHANLGFASFSARRDLDDPARVLVFARLVSTHPEQISAVVTLRADGETVDMRRISVPPANENGATGEATITLSAQLPGGGVLSVSHNHQDALATDNAAHLIMPAPAPPRIAVIHASPTGSGAGGEGGFLFRLFENFDPAIINTYSLDRFAELDQRELDAGALYDFIVFDRVSGHRLPGMPSVTFGGAPLGVNETPPSTPGGKRILSWDRQHPIMRQVSLDPLAYTGFGGYTLPHGATALASGPDGPVIALMNTRGARHVLVGFPLDLDRTNWPLHVSIAVFMQNVMEHLTLAGSGQVGLAHMPGAPITVRARADVNELAITPSPPTPLPRGEGRIDIPVEPGAMRTLPALRRVGVYRVEGAAPPMDRIAVSMLSDRESDIRPRSRLMVNAQPAVAAAADEVVPREIWPWVLAAALLLLFIEWLAYCRKAR